MDLSLGLENCHVVVTGGAGMIGRKVVEAFLSAGARVTSLDIVYPSGHHKEGEYFTEIHADISSEESLQAAWRMATESYGVVEVCIALAALDLSALPHFGVLDMPLDQFRRTMEVNVAGTFVTAREWLRGLHNYQSVQVDASDGVLMNVTLIMIGSESGWWGERTNPDYGSSKAAVQVGLLQSLRQEAPRIFPGARVNAIAPGAVNTPKFQQECAEDPEQYYLECQGTAALKKPVEMEQVAKALLWLASDAWSGSVHGQVVNVDSGKLGKVVWSRSEC